MHVLGKTEGEILKEELFEHLHDWHRLKDIAHDEFIRAMRSGRMIAFVGSYISEEFGYPEWGGMLKAMLGTFPKKVRKIKAVSQLKGMLSSLGDTKSDTVVDFDLLASYCIGDDWDKNRETLLASYEKVVSAKDSLALNRVTSNSVKALCDHLGISRIITLNYDIEFEYHLMAERHLSPGYGSKLHRDGFVSELKSSRNSDRSHHDYQLLKTKPDGRLIVSDCFHRDRADRLFEFAIGSPDFNSHIMHLHGRITDPETMIVSYGDYEKQYRQSDITKLPFEHAKRMLFAGNPVVFVGLGMSEDEILHVLREFVSDGRPSHLAPHFVIWNACSKQTQVAGKVSDEDEAQRLRFFRRFGVHLIFDTELDGYFTSTRRDSDRLRQSIEGLANFTREKITAFTWQADHFRSVAGFLPPQGKAKNIPDQQWRNGIAIWGVESSSSFFEPAFSYKMPQIGLPQNSMDDNEYITDMLVGGSPIKAFIDPPGTGHGYLAKVIQKFVTEELRTELLKPTNNADAQELIYLQFNAGFAWEIDTTFALVSGLYDHELAFDNRQPDRQNDKSRTASNQQWIEKIRDLIYSSHLSNRNTPTSGTSVNRNIVIVINGADRFFDSSGYPLSNELDILLRSIPLLSQDRAFYDWKKQRPHPVAILLLGTNRVSRYLKALAIPKVDIGRPFNSNRRPETRRGVDIYHQIPSHYGTKTGNPPSLLERITAQYRSSATTLRLPPLRDDQNTFNSAYLRATAEAFKAENGGNELNLPTGSKTTLELALSKRTGEQRRAFFDVYLRAETIAQVMNQPNDTDNLKWASLCLEIMRQMAFLGQPVEVSTLEALTKLHKFADKYRQALKPKLTDVIARLEKLNLVSRISPFPSLAPSNKNPHRYGLHRALLQELRDRNTVPISDARTYTSFNLPLLAAQPVDDHEPERSVQQELDELVDKLIEEPTPIKRTDAKYGFRLRAAAASVRSYHTTSSLLMHEPPAHGNGGYSPKLGDHARRIEKLISAMETAGQACNGAKCAFPEDLVWLHDQRGVTLLAQGDLYEARHALNHADAINHDFVEFGDHGQNWSRIEINKLHLDIERGKVSHAENRINRIEQAINHRATTIRWSDLWKMHDGANGEPEAPTAFDAVLQKYGRGICARTRVVDPVFPAEITLLTGILCGYRGWTEYIRGRLRTSEHFYEQAINVLRNIGEQRAYAMFMRHYASLLYIIGKPDKALDTIKLCIAASDSVRQMDLSHLAWLSRVEIEIGKGDKVDRGEALQQMLSTLKYANATGMYRVRMEARRALAKLRLKEGDFDGALEQASEAMAIATRFGFSLRKVSLRILIGQILIKRGDPVSGHSMLDQATRIADRIGYQRAVEQAHSIRVQPSHNISS